MRAEEIVSAHLKWEPGILGGSSALKIALSDQPPDGVAPPDGIRKAAYGSVSRGDGATIPVALDLDERHARLWIDRNLDGRLEEAPIRVQPPGRAWRCERTIALPVVGQLRSVPVVYRFYRTATCTPDHLHLIARVHRRGTVVLGGRLRTVAITDGNSDLRFDDPGADRLLLDLDGDRRLDVIHEVITPGRPFRLRDEGFLATVPLASGKAVEFRRQEQAPPAAPRAWTPLRSAGYSYPSVRPAASLAELKVRFAKDKTGTVHNIAALFSKQSCQFLVRLARKSSGEDASLRSQATRALGHKSYLPYASSVLALARDETDMSIAGHALVSLHHMGYPERERLYRDRLGRSSKSSVVRAAALGLVLLGTPEALQAVEQAAGSLSTAALRTQAYAALRYRKEGPPLEIMRAALEDASLLLRAYALEDMAKLGLHEARARALEVSKQRSSYVTLGRVVARVLGRAGDGEAVAALLRFAAGASANLMETVREELAPVRDPGAVAAMVAALKADEPAVRALAAELLASFPERRVTDALLRRAKKEKDEGALAAVLDSLGERADPRGIALLLSLAKKRKQRVRGAAIRALARIGPGHPKVRAFFFKLLDSPLWEDRVYALDAAGVAGDRKVIAKVVASLGHRVWQVRLAAAQALAQIRVKGVIEPLIALLEREEVKRVKAAAAESLFRITGQNFYDFADTWRRWWTEHGNVFKLPDELPKRKVQRRGGTVASFFGLPLDSGRIIFVIDQSGSMSATDSGDRSRLQTAVDEVLGAIGRLKTRDRANVILFETAIHPWKEKLMRLTSSVRATLERQLKSKNPMGGTNLYDGLELALEDRDVDTIFLLSDGVPGLGKHVQPADIRRAVRRVNQTRRIAIHCVSVGRDSELLEALAAENGGRYVRR